MIFDKNRRNNLKAESGQVKYIAVLQDFAVQIKTLEDFANILDTGLLMASKDSEQFLALIQKNYPNRMPNAKSLYPMILNNLVSDDFGDVYRLMVISLWSLLEGSFDEFIAGWLEEIPKARDAKEITEIMKNIRLQDDDWTMQAVEKLKKKRRKEDNIGVRRFEYLLRPFNLAAESDESLNRSIAELHAARNVLVHRDSIVDQQFLNQCEWLKLKIGDSISVDTGKFAEYCHAVRQYIKNVWERAEKLTKHV